MAKARSCDACRRRKTRCLPSVGDKCSYCERMQLDCTFNGSEKKIETVGPKQIHVKSLITPAEPISIEEPSYLPEGYDSGAFLGPSACEDPNLLQFYDKEADHVARFVHQGYHFLNDQQKKDQTPVVFSVYTVREISGFEEFDKTYSTLCHKVFQQVHPYQDRLLALYFKFVDWTYPAVDKRTFYQRYYFEPQRLHKGLLAGMLALSCLYWKYDVELCVRSLPHELTNLLWCVCLTSIDRELKNPTLETLQALMLYIQRRTPSEDVPEFTQCSVQVAKLLSLAFSLGLHIDCSSWLISEHEKMIRNRLWAVTYNVEKWSAACLGRPSLLIATSFTTPDFESGYPKEQTFVHYTRLTRILDRTLFELYSPQVRYARLDPFSLLPKSLKLLEDLNAWKSDLPSSLASMHEGKDGFSNNGPLLLAAFTVEVLLIRVLIDYRVSSYPLFQRFRNMAKELISQIVLFASDINHKHLHAFWGSTCSWCFDALAHFILYYHAQSNAEERKKDSAIMRKWLSSLKVLSSAWIEGVGLAARKTDAIFHKGEMNVKIPTMTGAVETNVNVSDMQCAITQIENFVNPVDLTTCQSSDLSDSCGMQFELPDEATNNSLYDVLTGMLFDGNEWS